MFYCDTCAKEHGWPQTGFTSYGKCEMCDKNAECNERQSSLLPPSKKHNPEQKDA